MRALCEALKTHHGGEEERFVAEGACAAAPAAAARAAEDAADAAAGAAAEQKLPRWQTRSSRGRGHNVSRGVAPNETLERRGLHPLGGFRPEQCPTGHKKYERGVVKGVHL